MYGLRTKCQTHTSPVNQPFIACTKLQVRSLHLDKASMSNISGEGVLGTIAWGAARGAAAGVGGMAIGIATAVVWHYYQDEIVNYVDETIDYWTTVQWKNNITGESGSYSLF